MANPNFSNERVFFHWSKALKKGREFVDNLEKLLELIKRAWSILESVKNDPHIKSVFDKLTSMLKLTKAYATGTYPKSPWKTILLIVAAIIYFVSPIDAIPDLIPLLGLGDDASVIAIIFNAIKPLLEDFAAWDN